MTAKSSETHVTQTCGWLNLRKEKRSSALKINNCKKTYHYIIKMQNGMVLFSLYHQGLEQVFN
jgi:hypothetical protein